MSKSKVSKWYNSITKECQNNSCFYCGYRNSSHCEDLKEVVFDFPARFYKELTSEEKERLLLIKSRENVGEDKK